MSSRCSISSGTIYIPWDAAHPPELRVETVHQPGALLVAATHGGASFLGAVVESGPFCDIDRMAAPIPNSWKAAFRKTDAVPVEAHLTPAAVRKESVFAADT